MAINRLIHLDIPQAITTCLHLASRIQLDLEEHKYSQTHRETLRAQAGYLRNLARDIRGLKYLTAMQVDKLVQANSFLKECRR